MRPAAPKTDAELRKAEEDRMAEAIRDGQAAAAAGAGSSSTAAAVEKQDL